MQFIIQVGGEGTRVNSITKGGPKALIKINNKTILDHQVKIVKKYTKKKIILLNNIKFIDIEKHLRKKKNIKYSIFYEDKPLGTAGSLCVLKKLNHKLYAMVFGDLIMDFNFNELKKFHLKKKSDLTLVVHPNDHPFDSDKVSLDKNLRVTNFHSKNRKENKPGNQCVSGIYLFNESILKQVKKNKFQDFCSYLIPKLLKKKFKIFGYITREYIKDAGTVKRIKQVERDLKNKKPKNISFEKKLPAIFIDKDGVINNDNYTGGYQDIKKIYSNIPKAIKKINDNNYLVIIVTNQPAIAKGFVKEEKVQNDFRYLESYLSKNKSYINRIYYCPHYPKKGFKGEVKKYKISCSCRKPKNGMILNATKDFNIDLKNSVMVGDQMNDYIAARNSKLNFYFINSKKKLNNVKNFKSLFEFSNYYFS